MTSKKPFPLYLALLLAAFIAFLGWSARQAATDGARITDRDYYSKGLRYNTSQLERQAASVLGWQVAIDLNERLLTLLLADRDGKPVDKAEIVLTLMTTKAHIPLPLDEQNPGQYVTLLPESISGEVSARYNIQHQGASIERQLLINLSSVEPH